MNYLNDKNKANDMNYVNREGALPCQEIQRGLFLFIDHEIHDPGTYQTFEIHFGQCPDCREELAHEQRVLGVMRDALASECCESAPEDLQSRITAQLQDLADNMMAEQLLGANPAGTTQIVTQYSRTEIVVDGETHIQIETSHEIRRDFPGF
jgi:anti-sigma factor (TIGR02949 family)